MQRQLPQMPDEQSNGLLVQKRRKSGSRGTNQTKPKVSKQTKLKPRARANVTQQLQVQASIGSHSSMTPTPTTTNIPV